MLAAEQIPEILIRGAAVGVFILMSLAILVSGRSSSRVTAALFYLSAAAHCLTQSKQIYAGLGFVVGPIWVFSVAAAGLLWAFTIELFDDSLRLRVIRFFPAALLVAVGSLAAILPPALARIAWLGHNLIGAALLIHALFVIWTGWREDLVEARRALRAPIIGIAAIYALAVVGIQSVELFAGTAERLSLLAASSLLAMSLCGGVLFLCVKDELFETSGRANDTTIASHDQHQLRRLMAEVDQEQVWRNEGLTIGSLATRLAIPEHQLRRLINQSLGYRNFTAFINERRITAAKDMLRDPLGRRTTIATIAFEVGFASLGPFNRAFRDATGQTPTQWRKLAEAEGLIPEITD